MFLPCTPQTAPRRIGMVSLVSTGEGFLLGYAEPLFRSRD